MKWGKVFLSLLLLLVFSGTVVLAEGGRAALSGSSTALT